LPSPSPARPGRTSPRQLPRRVHHQFRWWRDRPLASDNQRNALDHAQLANERWNLPVWHRGMGDIAVSYGGELSATILL
jgi:hypothetical protein